MVLRCPGIADAHETGAADRITSPVPLGVMTPPGELGADIVTAEGQSLGVAQSFGGPYVGLLGARHAFVRQMPGRLCGIAQDSEGKRGFVLTLQTREQHIRREKATSNICTNQGLMATAATVYMATLGPKGFQEVAERCYHNAHYLADQIVSIPGFELVGDGPFFNEFVVKCAMDPATINSDWPRSALLADLISADSRARGEPHAVLRYGIERSGCYRPVGYCTSHYSGAKYRSRLSGYVARLSYSGPV